MRVSERAGRGWDRWPLKLPPGTGGKGDLEDTHLCAEVGGVQGGYVCSHGNSQVRGWGSTAMGEGGGRSSGTTSHPRAPGLC